jgi:DNA end-binding protein Ku
MPSSVWKGSIVLSLISVPVRLYAAARSARTYLHQIHKVCNSRVRQPLFCPTCNRFVDRGEIVKGFEFDEGQYVLMEDKEIKKIAAASSHNLEIVAFTKLKEIDPIFFDSSYFCLPEDAGKKAYQLLVSLRKHRDRWDWETVDAPA